MAAARDEEENKGGADKHDEVDDFEAVWRDSAKQSNWQTENYTDVKNVATDDVANKELVLAALGGFDGGY